MAQQEQAAADAVTSPQLDPCPLLPPDGYEVFYRASYVELVNRAMTFGATLEQAKDAASSTMTEMLAKWAGITNPLGYARRAVISNFIKEKTRGNLRVAKRLVERGHVPLQEGAQDPELAVREGREWVADVLKGLPDAQREVMQLIADGFSRDEIPQQLGISPTAARKRLSDARARLSEILNRDGEVKNPRQPQETAQRREA